MNKTSRILSIFCGISLVFLTGLAAMAAEDAAKPGAEPQPTYAPGLPGWMHHLPADKQEVARKIWLTEGRTILSLRETMQAKRHELNALQDMPNPDEKAVAAAAKEMGATLEKLLMAQFAFHQKLEKEGIPTWGQGGMGMMHPMMMGPMGMMGGEQPCPMMGKMGGMGGPMMMHGKMGPMMAPEKAPAEKPAAKHN